jgi:DNA topoisomerase-1
VKLDKRRFTPEDRGRLVTAFLVAYFERYVDTGFTAGLEEQLDEISDGKAEWREVMHRFWRDFRAALDGTKDLKISDVIDRLDAELGPHFFPPKPGLTADDAAGDPRLCPACHAGRLGLRLGRTGAFIGCSSYPECRYTRPLAVPGAEGESAGFAEGVRVLGTDPNGVEVSMRRGPYGVYVQLGEGSVDAKGKPVKPRRASLDRAMDPEQMNLERALALLSMPRIVGLHPERGEEISSNLGRFGAYLKMGQLSKTMDKDDDPLTIGLNRAVALLADAKPRGITLGDHPKGGIVEVRRGRFGPYLMHGTRVANLPRGTEMEAVALDEAIALLAEKGKELPPMKGKGGRKAPARKAAAKAPAAEAVPRPAAVKKATAKPAASAKKASPKKPATKKPGAKKAPARAKATA